MCAAAYQKGLCAIGFSSHAPVYDDAFAHTGWHLKPERLEAYLTDIQAAKKHWEGRIQVFAGLEVDYIAGISSPLVFKDMRSNGLDYLIGSTHYLTPDHGSPFTVDGSAEEFENGVRAGYGGSFEAAVHAYWDAEEALVQLGGFDILGHVDLIKKNNTGDTYFSPTAGWYKRRVERLADSIASSGVTVEVNTGGITRKKLNELSPSPFFLNLLREKNVPLIITADAHCADHLDGYYHIFNSVSCPDCTPPGDSSAFLRRLLSGCVSFRVDESAL
jgi:histidinol-phosphatase (PHP family)